MDGLWTDRAALHRHRLAAVHIPAALRPSVDAFDALYTALKDADAKVQRALVAHADEIKHTQSAHDGLRASVTALAEAIVHADPSVRLEPFAPFGSSPSTILRKTRAGAARATHNLAKRVLASSPKKSVRDAANGCIKHAQSLDAAHSRLTPLTVHLKRAREERGELAADVHQQFECMRRLAKYEWRKTPAEFDAVFAPVERFRLNSKRRKTKDKSAQPTEPATPNSPQPAAPPTAAGAGQPAPAPPTTPKNINLN
jgi:hypothetical protein